MPTVTTPTTIDEFRRLSAAFLSGCRFPTGSVVVVVASTTGLRPIHGIFLEGAPTTDYDVATALAASSELAAYRVTVPSVDRLNRFLPATHGSTGTKKIMGRTGSAEPPAGAKFSDVQCIEVHVKWGPDQTTIYDLDPRSDAMFFTRGAVELFAISVYAAIYGEDYVAQFRDGIGP